VIQPAYIFGVVDWPDRIIWVVVIVVVAAAALAIVRRIERASTTRVVAGVQPGAARQRQTAVSALAAGARYLVVLAAIVGIVSAVFGADSVAALSGGALVVVVLGFSAQRLLTDVVAGFFILFENQFAVGDLVELDSTLPIGVVEKLGLRATVVRTFSGDMLFMPNSQIKAVRRLSHFARDMEIGVLVRDSQGVRRAVADAASLVPAKDARFVSPPVITRTDDLGNGLFWVRIRADVPPGFERLVTELLVDLIRARCGDDLMGDPMVSDSHEDVVRTYQHLLKPQ